MKTSCVKQKIDDSLVLQIRYPLYFGVAVYLDIENGKKYVLLLKDVESVLNKEQFLEFAREII